MEQKRPADIFQELLDYLWNGLGLEEKGWKRLKKGDFKKKMKNGLTYQIWFDRSRYNYIDYEIGHGNVEVGFTCIIKQGDDCLYSFKIEPTTGGSFFRMLTEDLRLDTGLLDTFLPLIQAHYLDFISRFEVDPAEALQPVCTPFIQPEDYSWCIHVREQMVERYGTSEQLAEYHHQAELRGTPGHKAKNWMGSMLFHLSHARFLVMIEREKCGPDMKAALAESGIFYCYLDDFYSGNSEDIKKNALFKEMYRWIDNSVHLNVNDMFDAALRKTRIEMRSEEHTSELQSR